MTWKSKANAGVTLLKRTFKRREKLSQALLAPALLLIGIGAQDLQAGAFPRFAYVADNAGNGVWEFVITPGTGALVPIAGCPFLGGANAPTSVMVHPSGNWLYVANNAGNTVGQYNINRVTGCLAAPVFVGTIGVHPFSIGMTAKGDFLYVSDNGGTIDAFTVNPANGALAPVAGSPFAAGANPTGLAVDPVGNCLYVANDVAGGTVTAQTINPATGVLGAAGVFGSGGGNPFGLAIDPVYPQLYVTNAGTNSVSSLHIAAPGCGLKLINNLATGAAPLGVAATSFGQLAFVASNGANALFQFLLVPPAGNLVLNAPPFVPSAGAGPIGVTVDQSGNFVYVADNVAGTVEGYTINPLLGTLIAIPGGPWAAPGAFAIATQP
jgi:6-phosphogluconolactonase (cycloisomerase 2 family)